MKYKLKIAAIMADIVPLSSVAEAMALHDATAGGTPYHEPMFEGRLTSYILDLFEEVRCGRLKVCNTVGSPISIDETEQLSYATRYVKEPDWEKLRKENTSGRDGLWNFSHIDLGPREIDKSKPIIYWRSKLKMLNEWAEKRGDSFSISHEGLGWVDERGYVLPPSQDIKVGRSEGDTISKRGVIESISEAWITSARNIAEGLVKHKKRRMNQDRLAELVHAQMEKQHRNGEPGMTGRGGRIPGVASIKRHALKGITC